MEKVKKVTKRENFNKLLTFDVVKNDSVLVDFINHELELLDKKNASAKGGEKKLTATQVANEGLKTEIFAKFESEPNRVFSITELTKEIPSCVELSNQKMSALLRQMVKADLIVKIEEGRKVFFQLYKE